MNPPNLPLSRKSPAGARQSAFSLVEVVLAVGVISFAFVAILGLLPAGLAQFRQAMDNSVGAQIAQRIILDCQQTDFTTLTTIPNGQSGSYIQPVVYSYARAALPERRGILTNKGTRFSSQAPHPVLQN